MQVLPGSSTSAVASSLYQSLVKVSSGEGLMTLWRGVNSVILGAGPAHAVYFGTYEIVKEIMGGNREGHQFVATGQSSTSLSHAVWVKGGVCSQKWQVVRPDRAQDQGS
jgi:solute carrier family 25 iron transporter 28/37